MEKFRFLEIKCVDEDTGRFVRIEDTTKSNPHMVFYRASDVDALLADVRRLVDEAKLLIESAEDSHSHCDCYEVATLLKCSRDTEKAIDAVERHFESNKNTQIKGIDNQK